MKTPRLFASIAVVAAFVLTAALSWARGFDWTNLVSDIPGVAKRVDSNLVNPWGIASSPIFNILWVADAGTGVSTLYTTEGVPAPPGSPLVVQIPPSASNPEEASPTGVVFNSGDAFVVSENGQSGPSRFIFVSEDGGISGWSEQVSLSHAILAVDHGNQEAVYKGAALSATGHGMHLYVTNFRSGKVEIYNRNFVRVDTANTFVDPNLPAGFAPFGIRNINGLIYVTYAKQDEEKEDDVAGPGLGFVNVFDTSGHFLKRLISHAPLNAPWGLALAPHNFGAFGDALLVGNFGNGRIHAFNPNTGAFFGTLKNGEGTALAFEGLWALHFIGNRLFFTAGIVDEEHGLFGEIHAQ